MNAKKRWFADHVSLSNAIRITRLKLLYIAAKVVKDQNRGKVKYSANDARTPAMIHFPHFMDSSTVESEALGASGILAGY